MPDTPFKILHFSSSMYNIQGYKVTKVTVPLKQILPKVTRFQKLRRLHRPSAEDFSYCPQSYKVTKVTVLVQIFKINSGFQGFRSYGGYGGLLLMIFLDIPRVTRLRRLRCFSFFQIFNNKNVPNLPSCFTGNKVKSYNAFSILFDQYIQGYGVTRLRK